MEYKIYKMNFQTGVHFGSGSLESHAYSFHADTLFSALCCEAVKFGEDTLQTLVENVKNGMILFSDALPYIGDMYYIPKPALRIKTDDAGDSKIKKIFKKMKYIPVSYIDAYLKGNFPLEVNEKFEKLGTSFIRTAASVRGEEETVPYRVGVYEFHENNGLYVIVGTENKEAKTLMENLLEAVSFSGIGGKRSSGLGRYELHTAKFPEELEQRLNQSAKTVMTLSVSLPKEEELDLATSGAQYKVIKRSGFVSSTQYADEFFRKKDLYVFDAGSCFQHTFQGDIYDVSTHGKHNVYRYAKPLFMGVDV